MTKLTLFVAGFCALAITSASAGSWREAAPLESGRTQVRAAAANNQIYVAGGATVLGESDIFEAYDPRSNKWLPLESMPEGRQMFGMAAHGGVVYVAGGLSHLNKGKPTASTYAFQTASSTWKRRANMPEPRSGHTLTAAGDHLYAIGGRGKGSDRVLRYNPATDEWTAIGSAMPAPRTAHGAAALGGKIYLIGGRSLAGDNLARVDVFDTASGKWSSAAGLPVAEMGLTADFVGNQLHIAGGLAPAQRKTLSDHYALASGSWQKQPAMPTPRQGLTSAVLDGKWFLIGGGTGSGALAVFTETDAVEIYSP